MIKIEGSCGLNLVGGYCPFDARDDDPLCHDHAVASNHGSEFVALDGRRKAPRCGETIRSYRRALGRLQTARASMPAHVGVR
jgi:hypothetical protein